MSDEKRLEYLTRTLEALTRLDDLRWGELIATVAQRIIQLTGGAAK